MILKTWFNKQPAWLKHGLFGMAVYIVAVVIDIAIFMIVGFLSNIFPNAVPDSLSFLIPLIIIAFYPGILLASSYQDTGIIIAANLVIYFIGGMLIGLIVRKIRKLRLNYSLSQI